jgi:hypothetical protein
MCMVAIIIHDKAVDSFISITEHNNEAIVNGVRWSWVL